jgi:hypothetical protein
MNSPQRHRGHGDLKSADYTDYADFVLELRFASRIKANLLVLTIYFRPRAIFA